MNAPFRILFGLTLLAPLAAGCAGRTAPFDNMDKAQITVLRLQGAPPPITATPAPGVPPIPGLPPEWQAGVQQGLQTLQQGLQQAIPGLPPIPGLTPQATPQAAPPPMFKGFVIGQQMPLSDETVRGDLLDLFGDEDSFTGQRGNCFTPGMGVSIISPDQAQPVELLISLSCNQAMGDGFRWPYPNNGFSPEAATKIRQIYEKLWGPVPPNGA